MNTRLVLEYDGGPFAGWAAQPGERSIESELRSALRTVLREEVPLTVAGRTDRGVHAWGQVANYPAEAIDPARLNGLLAEEIAVLSSEPAPAAFDARHDALSRTYCYRLLVRRERSALERGRALWVPYPIDRALLDECAAALLGSHDFSAFTPAQSRHTHFRRRVLRAEWIDRESILELWIEADSFMRHMNRVLVGTMLEVAKGVRTPEDFAALLDGLPRSAAGPTAPAHGLHLASISYGGEAAAPLPSSGK